MSAVRFVALGDSLTEGVGDPVDEGWRGWAALLADGLGATGLVEFHNLAVSGARTMDVLERQTPRALDLRPDLVSVVIGVNDTLRRSYDIHAVAAGLSRVYAAFAAQGVAMVTACLPDPGAMLRLPGPLARPLARRQQSVNAVVHALSERYDALHVHLTEEKWIFDRAMWSADRLHPGERGHRMLARRIHRMLAEAGLAAGAPPSVEPERPPPSWSAKARWLATKGTAWVLRRSTDLLPQLLALAGHETFHWARGTRDRLDARASRTAASALAALGGAGGVCAASGVSGVTAVAARDQWPADEVNHRWGEAPVAGPAAAVAVRPAVAPAPLPQGPGAVELPARGAAVLRPRSSGAPDAAPWPPQAGPELAQPQTA